MWFVCCFVCVPDCACLCCVDFFLFVSLFVCFRCLLFVSFVVDVLVCFVVLCYLFVVFV